MNKEDQPAQTPNGEKKPGGAGKSRTRLLPSLGDLFERLIGAEGLAVLKKRNWTLTGAVGGAVGIVADLMQIFGPVAAIGLAISTLFAAAFGAVLLMRLKWPNHCIDHFFTAILAAALFSTVLFVQQIAIANDGVIAKKFPYASKIQRAIYEEIVGLEEGQKDISDKLDLLTDEVREATKIEQLSKDGKNWVGTWVLETPYQPGWVVTYAEDGTYVFTSPQANLNGVWRASDGLFRNEAPGTGLSDAGSYRFRDENTLEVTGKFGMSVWKRIDAPQPPHAEQ